MVVPSEGTRIYLVRHGRVHNPDQVAYGFLPRMGLAEEGREQARRAGCYLRGTGCVALYTSPLLRAVQTARLIWAEMPDAPLFRSRALRESGLARFWQGKPYPELDAHFPELYPRWADAPGSVTEGESLSAQAERMRRAVRRMVRRHAGGPIILVSHRDPIVSLRLLVEGRPYDELHITRCEPGSITEMLVGGDRLQFTGYVEP
jgi:broad specificity phosphatase PhoE